MNWKNKKEKGSTISIDKCWFTSHEFTGKLSGLLFLLASFIAAQLSSSLPSSLQSNVTKREIHNAVRTLTMFHHTQYRISLWKMLNVKIYLEDNLAISSNTLNVHAFNVVITLILQRNYLIYLPMCIKIEVQRCSMLYIHDYSKQPNVHQQGNSLTNDFTTLLWHARLLFHTMK